MTAVCALPAISLCPMSASSQNPDFYIFLAFGQSNMEGFPGVETQDKSGVDARFQLLPAVNWPDNSRTKGTWTTAVPPLCRNTTGLCPCDYFGRTLVDSLPSNIKIGVINVSVAGCAIEMFDQAKYQTYVAAQAQWLKDIANLYGGNPYARLVEMGKAAQKDGVIKGILLHQGESGSSTGQWANEVKIIYNDLIKDLGLDSITTPLLAGDLVNSSTMIKNLPSTLKYAHVISSQGLGNRGDGMHFSTQGYRDFGKRYADTMLRILKKQVPIKQAKDRATSGYSLGNCFRHKNGTTSLSFEIPQHAVVSIKAYALGGQQIAEIAGEEFAAGRHTLLMARETLPAGLVVLKMKSGPFSATRTIMAGAR